MLRFICRSFWLLWILVKHVQAVILWFISVNCYQQGRCSALFADWDVWLQCTELPLGALQCFICWSGCLVSVHRAVRASSQEARELLPGKLHQRKQSHRLLAQGKTEIHARHFYTQSYNNSDKWIEPSSQCIRSHPWYTHFFGSFCFWLVSSCRNQPAAWTRSGGAYTSANRTQPQGADCGLVQGPDKHILMWVSCSIPSHPTHTEILTLYFLIAAQVACQCCSFGPGNFGNLGSNKETALMHNAHTCIQAMKFRMPTNMQTQSPKINHTRLQVNSTPFPDMLFFCLFHVKEWM